MKVSELIRKLEMYQVAVGDVDVLITDGYDARCYRGEYDVHALLLGCQLLGSSADIKNVLYFDCAGRIELHKEIDWNKL